VVKRSARRIFGKSYCGCGIGLRITIDQKCRLLRGSEASRQIYRGSRFSDPTLLICNSNNPRQSASESRKVSRITWWMQLVSRGTSAACGFRRDRSTWNIGASMNAPIPPACVPRGTILDVKYTALIVSRTGFRLSVSPDQWTDLPCGSNPQLFHVERPANGSCDLDSRCQLKFVRPGVMFHVELNS
jgi:hypothetical protein